jgi:hypothetical protein
MSAQKLTGIAGRNIPRPANSAVLRSEDGSVQDDAC